MKSLAKVFPTSSSLLVLFLSVTLAWPGPRRDRETGRHSLSSSSLQWVKHFDGRAFAAGQRRYNVLPSDCRKTILPRTTVGPYFICRSHHNMAERRRRAPTQPDVTRILLRVLQKLSATVDPNRLFYVDLGANEGAHAIPVAKAGYQTWAVEPVERNLVRNAIGSKREELKFMSYDREPRGGHVWAGAKFPMEGKIDKMKAVPISDVVTDILEFLKHRRARGRGGGPITVVMKVDVQFSECRAFLGSADALFGNRDAVFVPFIVMEWAFFESRVLEAQSTRLCPPDMLREFKDLLVSSGYVPRSLDGRELDPLMYRRWRLRDVTWTHAEVATSVLDIGGLNRN